MRFKTHLFLRLLTAISLTLFFGGASHLLAQSAGTSGLAGTVTDPSGASVPNAKVTVTSVKQGTAETVTTNETGNYAVYHLIPGTYDVSIEGQGFKTLQDGETVEYEFEEGPKGAKATKVRRLAATTAG